MSVYAAERGALVTWRHTPPRARRSVLVRAVMWLAAGCLELEPAHAEPVRPDAKPLELRVAYRAPDECPSGADFLDAVRGHLVAGGEGAIDADVRIRRVTDVAFELVLYLRVADEQTESVVRADSCAALMQLAALNASMARTPAPPEEAAETSAPRAQALLPMPQMRVETIPGGGRLVGLDAPLALDAPPAEERVTARALAPQRAFVLAELRTASGMLPSLSYGQGVAVGLERVPWSLRLAATWWTAQERAFDPDGSSPVPLRFEQQSLELSPCLQRALSAPLHVEGCASLAAHRIQTSAEAPRLKGSIGAAGFVVLSPWRGLRIEAGAGVMVAVRAPSFDIGPMQSVHRADTLQPFARVALGWAFGGERAHDRRPLGEALAQAPSRGGP
jgi:hypothetical protein